MMRVLCGVAAAIILAGCASVQPGRGFDKKRRTRPPMMRRFEDAVRARSRGTHRGNAR